MKRYIRNAQMYAYKAPAGPASSDMDWIAGRIAYYLKGRHLKTITTEDVIDEFRRMNDDYDDWFTRGLRTYKEEQVFVYDLVERLADYGITDVVDNTF